LISAIALAVGGPGTSAVYAWPSFVMYRLASRWAMSEAIEVPLTSDLAHDLEAMRTAVREDTTVVYLCNPNNPTGTIVGADQMSDFIGSVPESTLVLVDEAYHDNVTDDSYATAIPHALATDNVVVLRTFSKVYALAGHRIGYGVAAPETIEGLRKAQPPFSVTDFGQAAAVASIGDPVELKRRIEANAAARHHLLGALAERSLPHTQSHTNFVYFETAHRADAAAAMFTSRGVIVRPMSGRWLRVTIGHDDENRRLIAALDEVLDTPAGDFG
jgi:histidinol-phosphate aminotransferase